MDKQERRRSDYVSAGGDCEAAPLGYQEPFRYGFCNVCNKMKLARFNRCKECEDEANNS